METISAGAVLACYQEVTGKRLSLAETPALLLDIAAGRWEGAMPTGALGASPPPFPLGRCTISLGTPLGSNAVPWSDSLVFLAGFRRST